VIARQAAQPLIVDSFSALMTTQAVQVAIGLCGPSPVPVVEMPQLDPQER